jgi:hypothetical protein
MAETPAESREALLRYLEELSGRRLASRSDVRAFLQEKEALRPQDLPSVRRWRTAKRATIGALFVFAALQYHLMDVFLEIMSLRETTYFVPVATKTAT